MLEKIILTLLILVRELLRALAGGIILVLLIIWILSSYKANIAFTRDTITVHLPSGRESAEKAMTESVPAKTGATTSPEQLKDLALKLCSIHLSNPPAISTVTPERTSTNKYKVYLSATSQKGPSKTLSVSTRGSWHVTRSSGRSSAKRRLEPEFNSPRSLERDLRSKKRKDGL
nr:unknown [Sea turtle tornovirus 1]ACJ54462.1 unknown [Sea turtle tornovirus 1]ACJ54466.1 unknown [Sea turtle tornovirus 1]ACJ54469.1 unknown [Sea turtle tornovirus 1]